MSDSGLVRSSQSSHMLGQKSSSGKGDSSSNPSVSSKSHYYREPVAIDHSEVQPGQRSLESEDPYRPSQTPAKDSLPPR